MTDDEMDVYYAFVELCLQKGRYAVLDAILCNVEVNEKSDVDEILTLLTTTLCVADRLPHRAEFLAKAKLFLGHVEENLFTGL